MIKAGASDATKLIGKVLLRRHGRVCAKWGAVEDTPML